jgi:hypothetical protein
MSSLSYVVNVRTPEAQGCVYAGRGPGGSDMLSTPIGKRGWLGNPYKHRHAIECFKTAFLNRLSTHPEFREAVLALKGRAFGCFCHPNSCHAQVIVDWLNSQEEPQ